MISQIKICNFVVGFLFAAAMTALSTSASYAGWKEDVRVFKVGIVSDRERSTALRQIEPFREALAEEINMPVSVFVYKNYRRLMDAQANKKIQYGVHSASSFATAWAKCRCITPIAAAKLANGALKYRSILIVKKDRYSKLSDMKGRRIAVSSKKSLSGYIVPKHELDGKTLRFVDLPGKYDDTVIVVAGTTSASRKLFQSGLVDGLFGWNASGAVASDTASDAAGAIGTLFDLTSVNLMGENELQIIWKSKPIFAGPHAIAAAAPDNLRIQIGSFLLNLYHDNPRAYDSIENYRGGGFAEVELSNYQSLIDLVDAREKTPDVARSE